MPWPSSSCPEATNFRECDNGEVRSIPLLRGWMNKDDHARLRFSKGPYIEEGEGYVRPFRLRGA